MIFYLQMFGISLALTLFIEVGLAFLLKIRGKSLIPVVLVNILTNPAVVFVVHFLSLKLPMTLIPEMAAVVIEGAIYCAFNKREGFQIKRGFLKSLILNTVSYSIGLILEGSIL